MDGPVGVGDADGAEDVGATEDADSSAVVGATGLVVAGAEEVLEVRTDARDKTFRRFPAPQNSLIFPAHGMLQSPMGAGTDPAPSLSPQ